MEESAQLERVNVALRAAYAAFNRGDIDAAVEPLDAQIEWSELLNSRELVRTRDAREPSNILRNHVPPGPK